MKAIAFVTRLGRALNVTSPQDLTVDARQEILDAINGAIQRIDELSGSKSKTTNGAFFLPAPETISLGVTNGSATITGYSFTTEHFAKTIRVGGDKIDNQVKSPSSLLHTYKGATGTVSAVIYGDAIYLPEPYLEIIGDPMILEISRILTKGSINDSALPIKDIGIPTKYWIEGNAGNRNPDYPAIVKFHPMPDQHYRIKVEVSQAPVRIKFADLLAPGEKLPVREEWIESYLLPIALSNLSTSELWKNKQTKNAALTAGEMALRRFAALMPSATYATPSNEVGTPSGF
jgi:hypothetical protein